MCALGDPAQGDAVFDADEHVRSGFEHPLDAGHAGKVAVQHPDAVGGERVGVGDGLVQQDLLGLAFVAGTVGGRAGRAGRHRQRGAGRGVRQAQLPQLGVGGGVISGACVAEGLPVGGVSGVRISDPSAELERITAAPRPCRKPPGRPPRSTVTLRVPTSGSG